MNDFQKQIWINNYKSPNDKTIQDTFRRVANAIAQPESDQQSKKLLREQFFNIMNEWKFIPGGRIIANAGVKDHGKATLYNCYVYHPYDFGIRDIDSMQGIFQSLKKSAKILASQGGLGVNLSFIRPNGSYIVGTGARSPGVLKFMELWDKSSEVITMGSNKVVSDKFSDKAKKKIRKGAMLAAMDISHSQIKQFITAKQTSNRLQKFNLSVLIPDRFLQAVAHDQNWKLCFPDVEYAGYKQQWDGDLQGWIRSGKPVVVHEQLPARQLWDLIMMSTYNRNEPGVLFYDTINDYNPVNYCQKILTTNPCVTGDTLIAVADGRNAVSIKQLAQQKQDVPVYCLDAKGNIDIQYMRNPRITGYNEDVYEVVLDNGNKIKCTGNHKFILKDGSEKQTKELQIGSSLLVHKKMAMSSKQMFGQKSNGNRLYYAVLTNKSTPVYQHRLVINKLGSVDYFKGKVIHHKDFNSLNNNLDNLVVMSKEDHDKLHSELMKGDGNPMRRWYPTASTEQKERYHDNMSKSIGGENNPNYSGISNEQLYSIIKQFVLEHQRPITKSLYKHLSEKLGLPNWGSSNKYRGSLLYDFLNKVNMQCGYKIFNNRVIQQQYYKYFEIMANTDLDIQFVQDTGEILVHKQCQQCGNLFTVQWMRREISICSEQCAVQYKLKTKNFVSGFDNGLLGHKCKQQQRTNIIDEYFNNYVLSNCEIPKPELVYEYLKVNNIPDFRSIKFGSYQQYVNNKLRAYGINEIVHTNALNQNEHTRVLYGTKLKQSGLFYNHKVVAINYIGKETVYNGTVDINHNFGIALGRLNNETVELHDYIDIVYTPQCGQIPQPSNVCNLGSLNLPMFYHDGEFDFAQFQKVIKYAVCFLDNVCDVSYVPLQEYARKITQSRRIGLGVMGLGSLLMMMGMKFGSHEAIEFTQKIFKFKAETELLTSSFLGNIKGSFTSFDKQKYFTSKWWYELPISYKVKRDIENIGAMRNAVHSDAAPTGNSSIFSGQVSNGIQPVFSREYTRWVVLTGQQIQQLEDLHGTACLELDQLTRDPMDLYDTVIPSIPDPQVGQWYQTQVFKFAERGNEQILRGTIDGITYQIDKNRGIIKPMSVTDYGWNYVKNSAQYSEDDQYSWCATTDSLTVDDHLNMLAASAKYINQNQSKTINIPEHFTYEQFKNVYMNAWRRKIKGITTYRAGTMTVVLEQKKVKQSYQSQLQKLFAQNDGNVILADVSIPQKSYALQYKIKDKNKKKWYFTISFADKALKKPFALFIRTNQRESNEVTDLVIQAIDELLTSYGIRQDLMAQQRQKYVGQSNVDKIGRSIGMALRHNIPMSKIVQTLDRHNDGLSTLLFHIRKTLSQYIEDGTKIQGKTCEACGGNSLIYQSGCSTCSNCGSSRCG